MDHKKQTGLIAAVHTPVHKDFSLNLDPISSLASHLVNSGVSGVYVSGTTGEGQSFTTEERTALFHTWGKVIQKNNLSFFAHIGHQSQDDSCLLASAAKTAGAHALSAMAPKGSFIDNAIDMVNWLKPVLAKVPDIPFYYYDSPVISGIEIDIVELLNIASDELPSLVGVKSNNTDLDILRQSMAIQDGKYDILFGVDEMLTDGLEAGCKGAVGSTYNFAAPIYHKLMECHANGDQKQARELQLFSRQFIDIIATYDFLPAAKSLMKYFGVDCGPARPPYKQLSESEIESLQNELESINFFKMVNGQ